MAIATTPSLALLSPLGRCAHQSFPFAERPAKTLMSATRSPCVGTRRSDPRALSSAHRENAAPGEKSAKDSGRYRMRRQLSTVPICRVIRFFGDFWIDRAGHSCKRSSFGTTCEWD